MKKFLFTSILAFIAIAWGYGQTSAYCETEVKHLGLPAEDASAINLTITNQDATTMLVEIESANMDPVDLLLVINGSGATISDENTTVPGKISRTLTWAMPPADVTLNVLWSKESFAGNWQLSPMDITVPFAANCDVTPQAVSLPITFDDMNVNYELADFGGNTSQIIVDPTDPTNMVVESVKGDMAELWAGTTAGENGLAEPIPFTNNDTKISVRVWSPDAAIPVRLKVEDAADAGIFVETELTTTVAMAWDTLEFDFANPVPSSPGINLANTYDKISIFFNFGTTGAMAGEKTYYWDDVQFLESGIIQPDLPLTFDESNVAYNIVDFGGNGSQIVVDPTDPTNMVVESVKGDMAELWAGTTAGGDGLASAIPFSASDTKISVRVWSPDAAIPVRLKVEDAADAGIFVETEVLTTVAMAWDTLEFDFANPVPSSPGINLGNTYDKISIFFNFGTTGAMAGEKTYYWDDVQFIEGVNNESEYCETEVKHLGLPAEDASAILLTIANISDTSMIVEIESANMDPVDLLLVTNGSGAVISNEDLSVPGKISRTLTWATPPADVTLNVLWSKESFAGNWQLSPMEITVPFAATCPPPTLDQVDLPITFDDANVDYAITDFGGNVSQIVVDPTDPANMVVESIKTGGAEIWAGTTAGNNGLANPIPFSNENTKMSVRVWSPDAGTPIRLKAENNGDGNIFVETEVLTTVAMEWDTLEFDFSLPAAGTPALDINNTYDKVSIFFNFGTDGATAGEKTYYWDDVQFVEGGGLFPLELPITFDDPDETYTLVDFGGNASNFVDDPENPGNTVVESIRTNAAEVFAGTTAGKDGLTEPIPFSMENTKMSVRVWAADAGTPVRLKVEDVSNGAIAVETEVLTTVGMAWDTLEFDFSAQVPGTPALNLANTYNKVAIFFDFGVDGATLGEKTYYWDDVQFIEGGGIFPLDLPITFDDPDVNYTVVDFGGNASQIVEDPTDPTNTVVESLRTNTAEVFAGTTAGKDGLTDPIPFTMDDTKMSVRVWAPAAGIPVRLKVENFVDPGISVETEVVTSVAMDWETLEFNFADHVAGTAPLNIANVYNKVSIFFNFGTDGATAGEQTYYWDDVQFVEGGGVELLELPITFDDSDVSYTLADFGGNVSAVVVDPTDPGNMVAESVKTDGAEVWAGTTAGLDGLVSPIPFTMDMTQMSVRVWSPDAGTPIRLKVEDKTDGNIFVETEVNTTVAMEWETLVFDFSNEVPGTPALDLNNSYDKISIFFNFGTDGATAGEKTYYWDDVMMFDPSSVQIQPVNENSIAVFPNPANTEVTIAFTAFPTEPVQAMIFNATGQLVSQHILADQQTTISTGDLTPGMYFIHLDNQGTRTVQRLIIVR
jgi:hypothetical protein